MKTSSMVCRPTKATSLPPFPIPYSFFKAKSNSAALRSFSAGPAGPRFLFHQFAAQPTGHILGTLCVHSGQRDWCPREPQSSRRDRQARRRELRARLSVFILVLRKHRKGGILIILGVGGLARRRLRHLSYSLTFPQGAGGPRYLT